MTPMPTLPKNKARQVSSLGESPAEARRRMQSSGGAAAPKTEAKPPLGEEVAGPLQPKHIAAIREAEEGFSGGGPTRDGTTQEVEETTEPPTPSKAMEVIRQLSQEKLQLQSELNAALNLIGRYKVAHGELD